MIVYRSVTGLTQRIGRIELKDFEKCAANFQHGGIST